MEFNSDKLECIEHGWDLDLTNEYEYIQLEFAGAVARTDEIRDLGIIFKSNGDFSAHINKVISKVRQLMGWMFRSFNSNTIEFAKFMWKSYIQGLLDYGGQVWGPVQQSQLLRLESL